MIKALQAAQKQEKLKMKLPKSVQQAIPIQRIWQDGTFQFGSKFSQTVRFSDINYCVGDLSVCINHKRSRDFIYRLLLIVCH